MQLILMLAGVKVTGCEELCEPQQAVKEFSHLVYAGKQFCDNCISYKRTDKLPCLCDKHAILLICKHSRCRHAVLLCQGKPAARLRDRGVPKSIVMLISAATNTLLTRDAATSVACACKQATLSWLMATHVMLQSCYGHVAYRCTCCPLHESPQDFIQKLCARQSCCLSALTHTLMWSLGMQHLVWETFERCCAPRPRFVHLRSILPSDKSTYYTSYIGARPTLILLAARLTGLGQTLPDT